MPAWIASSVFGCLFMKSTTTSVVMVPMAARMAVATHDGVPVARDVARIWSTARPLSGAVQFERSV
jgi:hypothetical protein